MYMSVWITLRKVKQRAEYFFDENYYVPLIFTINTKALETALTIELGKLWLWRHKLQYTNRGKYSGPQ